MRKQLTLLHANTFVAWFLTVWHYLSLFLLSIWWGLLFAFTSEQSDLLKFSDHPQWGQWALRSPGSPIPGMPENCNKEFAIVWGARYHNDNPKAGMEYWLFDGKSMEYWLYYGMLLPLLYGTRHWFEGCWPFRELVIGIETIAALCFNLLILAFDVCGLIVVVFTANSDHFMQCESLHNAAWWRVVGFPMFTLPFACGFSLLYATVMMELDAREKKPDGTADISAVNRVEYDVSYEQLPDVA